MASSRRRGRINQGSGSGGKRKKPPKTFLQKQRSNIAYGFAACIVVVAILSVVIIVKNKPLPPPKQYEPENRDVYKAPEEDVKPEVTTKVTAQALPLKQKPKGKIAVIIDDLGASRKVVDRLLAIEEPITFSVLPHLKRSSEVATMLMEKGRVVMLHLPMEPESKKYSVGRWGLLTSHSDKEMVDIINADLDSLPSVLGVNNHMGSLFTQSEEKVSIVLNEVKRRGLFFVDSRTSSRTVAYDLALKLGVPTARRDIFLDNEKDKEKVSKLILQLARKAIRNGSAIGIGHPHAATIAALKETLPEVKRMGVEVVPITELLTVRE